MLEIVRERNEGLDWYEFVPVTKIPKGAWSISFDRKHYTAYLRNSAGHIMRKIQYGSMVGKRNNAYIWAIIYRKARTMTRRTIYILLEDVLYDIGALTQESAMEEAYREAKLKEYSVSDSAAESGLIMKYLFE